LSLFQFSRLVKLSSPLCSPDLLCHYIPTHTIISCIPCNHLFPIMSVTLALFAFGSSLHGCFAIVRHPAITLSASPATCAVSLVRERDPPLSSSLFFPRRYASATSPSPLLFIFLPSPEAPLRAIPAITATIIYASHRSKHVLPSFFLLCWSILHFLFFTCSFPPLFLFFPYPHCKVFSFFFYFPHLQSMRMYKYSRTMMYIHTSALSAVATAVASAYLYHVLEHVQTV